MIILIGFAFLAGIITVLSPCVLPVLPIILSGSVGGGRKRPWGIITGFILSFTVLTLTLTLAVRSFGIDPGTLRIASAVIIIALALVLVVPALKDRFMTAVSSLLSRSPKVSAGPPREGFIPGLATGVSLGAVWTPCVGPIMASVISLALSQSVDAASVFITVSYALGTAVPLFAVMQGGRALIARFPFFTARLGAVQRLFGALMLLAGVSLLTGWDRNFQSWMLETFPGYGSGLTAIEDNASVRAALEKKAGRFPSSDVPDRAGSDPLSRTSGAWFNSEPLTLSGLEGKVVLVDFWTYSCVNCIRTMPYLKAWHEKYGPSGLVIVGVHSPEFAFERDGGNVEGAIRSIGIAWPVVQDNDFGIWSAFSNRFWPAHYIFDRTGKLVSTHFGEGAYAETEKLIQTLVGDEGSGLVSDGIALEGPGESITPETYLGTERGSEFAGLTGNWKREGEYSESEDGAVLEIEFTAREVFLVLSTVESSEAEMTVTVDGLPVNTKDARGGKLVPLESRLYQLYGGPEKQGGKMIISIRGAVRVHAFTFS